MKFLNWSGPLLIGLMLTGCVQQSMNRNVSNQQVKLTLDKEVTNQNLSLEGTIPDWLEGTFVRNGPVSVSIDGKRTSHWFDGLAMLHAFTFHKGQVSYTNRFLRTDAYYTVMKQGSLDYLGFSSMPPHFFWAKMGEFIIPPPCPHIQNANVNVACIAKNHVALTEIPLPVRFDIQTLSTQGNLNFRDNLPEDLIFESAHPQFDKRTQEQYNYLVEYGLSGKYVIYKYDNQIPYRHALSKISVNRPSYMHSFALTENYIVLVEYPFVVRPLSLIFISKPFIKNFYWDPRRGTNFLVIDRRTGQIVRSIKDCEPFFAFHHVNAFERGNDIILDIITYPNADIVTNISSYGYFSGDDTIPGNSLAKTKLVRYQLSLSECCIQKQTLLDAAIELPRVNENYSAHSYRYMYGSDIRPILKSKDPRPIYKLDTITKMKKVWQEEGVLPGEPVFIPNPNAKDEDDGVIVNIMLQSDKHRAFLLILDAKTFKELGRAFAPFPIPAGLHGQFFKNCNI